MLPGSPQDAILAYDMGKLHLHSQIVVRFPGQRTVLQSRSQSEQLTNARRRAQVGGPLVTDGRGPGGEGLVRDREEVVRDLEAERAATRPGRGEQLVDHRLERHYVEIVVSSTRHRSENACPLSFASSLRRC